MTFRWYFYLLYPFTALNTLVALLQFLVYRPVKWRWRAGCVEMIAGTFERNGEQVTRIWGRPAAQSLGCPVIYFANERDIEDEGLGVHERVHTYQGVVINAQATCLLWPLLFTVWFDMPGHLWWPLLALGPAGFGIVYGGHFLWEWMISGFGAWQVAYRRIWAERIAHRIQGEFNEGKRPGAWGGEA